MCLLWAQAHSRCAKCEAVPRSDKSNMFLNIDTASSSSTHGIGSLHCHIHDSFFKNDLAYFVANYLVNFTVILILQRQILVFTLEFRIPETSPATIDLGKEDQLLNDTVSPL